MRDILIDPALTTEGARYLINVGDLLKFPQSSMDGMQIHCWRLCMPQDYERCLVHWAMKKQGKGLFWTSGWVPYPGTWEGWLLPRLFAIISKLLKCENTCFLFGTYHHILPILVRVVIDNRQVVVIKLWKWFLHDISETVIWKNTSIRKYQKLNKSWPWISAAFWHHS